MKKSHLTLAILTAVLVSACGGSSSNDDATKDHGKPITPSKTTPTTPTKTTPTTPTTNDNSAKKPSTPTTSTTPSDSTPSTPTKTTTPTPTETTTPAKTLEQAKKDLPQDTKKLEDATKETNDLAEKLGQKLTAKTNAEKALKELANKTGKAATPVEIAAAQVALANATLDADNAQVKAAEAGIKQLEAQKSVTEDAIALATGEERDTVKAEKELVRAKFLLAQMNKFLALSKANVVKDDSDKKQAEVDHLQAQYDAKVNDLATAEDTSAEAYQEAKQALSNAAVSGDEEQLTTAQKKFNDAKTALEGGNSSLKDIGEKLADARTKAKEAASKVKESQKAAEEAENKLTPEEQAMKEEVFSPYNGVRFSNAKNDTFGEVRSVSYDKEAKKWSIVLKDKTDAPLMVDVPKDNASKPYGTFTAAKESNPAKGVKATAYSAYGYVGDKFFSVGKLISLKDYVSKAIKAAATTGEDAAPQKQELKYQGTAFVNATVKGKDKPQAQVADFEATATFGDSNTLTGSFSHFQNYTNSLPTATPTEKADDEVKFESTINPENSSFATAEDKADVKVQGFFYQVMNGKDVSSAVGGLVDSKKEGHVFKGAFGGEQVTQPTTTQTATTQTAGQ